MLTGGVSMMKGLYSRLNRELSVMSKGVIYLEFFLGYRLRD